MKKTATLLFLLLLAARTVTAAVDSPKADFLGRLDGYYYCLSRQGLEGFQCDATARVGDQHYPFHLSVGPALCAVSPAGEAPADDPLAGKVSDLLGSALKIWKGLAFDPLFPPEQADACSIVREPAPGFTVWLDAGGMKVGTRFDAQAVARRLIVLKGGQTIATDLFFYASPRGRLLRRVDIRNPAGAGADDPVLSFRADYRTEQGFFLPGSLAMTVKDGGTILPIDFRLSNYRLHLSGESGTGAGGDDVRILPASAEPPDARHFLWRVRSGPATVYLLGSIHIRPDRPLLLPAVVERCFESSDYVGFEFDMSRKDEYRKQMADYLKAHFTYPPGESLLTHLTAGQWRRVRKVVHEDGLDEDKALTLKPLLLGMTLSVLNLQKRGWEGEKGIDEIFLRKAQARGKPVFGMEFWWEPFQALERMPEQEQVENLLESLKGGDGPGDADRMLEAWQEGDTRGMEAILDEDTTPSDQELMDKLLGDRNRKWMRQLKRIFKTRGTYFIVVGSGHMVGPDGLPSRLRKAGYAVKQL